MTDAPEIVPTEVIELSQEIQRRHLAIGAYLLQAYRRLGAARYREMIRSKDLPFSSAVARKLKRISEAVEHGRLRAEDLPVDYAVAYLLVALDDEEFKEATQRRLVRPDLTRRELEAFRRFFRATSR